MKQNLIAGFVCVTLFSACSSQKITTGDTTPASPASTDFSTSETNRNAAKRAGNSSTLKSANTAQMPKATYSK